MTSHEESSSLRTALMQSLVEAGVIECPNVYIAMSRAPRHLFVPGVDPETAYADDVVVTKVDEDGRPVSSASAPWLVATMLEYARISPGDRCLEIGTGTGYNAWIMRHIAGCDGSVRSIEIDPEISRQAAMNLDAADSHGVELIVGDGARGHLPGAPYDVIMVTAGSWDIPPAWVDQLAEGGRLVVPLRWRGQTRCLALRRVGDMLTSEQMCLCGFIPMRNDDGEVQVELDSAGRTLVHDRDQDVDAEALIAAYREVPSEVWTEVHMGAQEPLDPFWLHVIMREHGACMSFAPGELNLVVIAEHDSMAMLSTRRRDDAGERRLQLGALGYGPEGEKLASRLAEYIADWSTDRKRLPGVRVYPAGSDTPVPAGRSIEKVFTRLVMVDGAEVSLSLPEPF